MERSNSEEHDQIDRPPVRQEKESAPEPEGSAEAFQSDGWWRVSAPASDWAEPVSENPGAEIAQRKEDGTTDIYFCGQTSLFPLNLAIRAIGKENLTGLLRARWDKEPVEVLARDGEIVLATTRDLDLYCSETPPILAEVDPEMVNNARDQQKENSTPFLLTLSRNESNERPPAVHL